MIKPHHWIGNIKSVSLHNSHYSSRFKNTKNVKEKVEIKDSNTVKKVQST